MTLNYSKLSNEYSVKRLTEKDIESVLDLYNSNPDYFKFFPPMPSIESIKLDMSILPPGCEIHNKYYLGYWDEKELVGVLDIILRYPDVETVYIGLFMIDKRFQSDGRGSKIIMELIDFLTLDYKFIQLALMKENKAAQAFWEKNGFKIIGNEVDLEHGNAVKMKLTL